MKRKTKAYPSLLALIKLVRPDVYVKGRDWIGKRITGQDFLESINTPIIHPPNYINITTTEIIRRIKSNQPSTYNSKASDLIPSLHDYNIRYQIQKKEQDNV